VGQHYHHDSGRTLSGLSSRKNADGWLEKERLSLEFPMVLSRLRVDIQYGTLTLTQYDATDFYVLLSSQ
jgi:hypothetical protein